MSLGGGTKDGRGTTDSQADHARKANSPWRGENRMRIGSPRAVRDNAQAQSRALKRMSLVERETGRSEEYWAAWHAENRARVLARYGIKDAA